MWVTNLITITPVPELLSYFAPTKLFQPRGTAQQSLKTEGEL